MRLAPGAVGALVGVVLLAGCSSGPEPANDTLPSAAPTSAEASETLTPLGPPDLPMPPEAREQTPAGAEAFLRYYLALVTHQAGKDGESLRALSRDCRFCDFIADRYDQDAAAGYTYRGGAMSIDSLSPPAMNGDLAEFSFTLSQGAVDILGPNGAAVTGRGEVQQLGLNAGASMTWSPSTRSWLMNQLIVNQQ